MDHDEWLELISASADGELADDEARRLDTHLAGCEACTQLRVEFEDERRRQRMHTVSTPDHLIDEILTQRQLQREDIDRTRTVLVRRAAAAATGLAAAVFAVVLMASGGTSAPNPAPQDPADVLIAAKHQSFDSAHVEVDEGTTVEWRNASSTTHHLVRKLGAVTVEEDLPPGRTEVATFDQSGTFSFYCEIHPSMQGTVTVDA